MPLQQKRLYWPLFFRDDLIMEKNKLQLEYVFDRVSTRSLWRYLSTPDGLSEWFAYDVRLEDNGDFYFQWDKNSGEKASILEQREGERIRFQWHREQDQNACFEFVIHHSELTGGKSLEVIDYIAPEEVADMEHFWNNLISRLRLSLGAPE